MYNGAARETRVLLHSLVQALRIGYHHPVKSAIAKAAARHVVWDWNGTLLDDTQACIRAINHMLSRRKLQPLDTDRYRRTFGFPVRGYYAALGFDLEREDWDALAREFHDHYHAESRTVGLRDGIERFLAELSERDIPMSILSASESTILTRMLREQGIDRHFGRVFGLSDLYAGSKVQRGRQLIEEIALPPAEVLLVGDTIHDYEVARELGCRCVLLAGGHQATDRLMQCGCKVLTDPSALLDLVLRSEAPKSSPQSSS